MRKFSWILALMTALAMVFIACPSEGGGGADWDLPEVTWKYIEILPRSAAWHSIDIRVQNNLTSDFTSGKAHTITVWGAASGGGAGIAFGGAQVAQGDISSPVSADPKNKGRFKLSHTFAWDLLTDIGNGQRQDIRVNGIAASATTATFWEVLIVDADGKEIYRLSTDPIIQAMENNYPVLQEGGNKTKWFVGALGGTDIQPVGYIKDPGSTSSFVAVTDITGVPTEGNVGIELTLGGIAQPVGLATNSTITWSLVDAGVTGATVVDGVLKTITGEGTVKVLATVVNGKSATEDFTKEFTITIQAGLAVGDAVFDLADWLDGKNLGAITGDLPDPFQKGGTLVVSVTATGLSVTAPEANWAGLDIYLTNARHGTPMDIKNQKYKLVVTGKMITSPTGTKMRFQEPNGSNSAGTGYAMLVEQEMTGAVDEAFTLTYDIPAWFLDSGKTVEGVHAQDRIRLQSSGVDAAPFPEYLIETVKLTFEGPRDAVAQYTIKFDSDGGNTISDITVSSGLQVGTLPTPEKAGYKFRGWFLPDNTTEIKATTIATSALDGVTLKAKWDEAPALAILVDEPDTAGDTLFVPAGNWNGTDKYDYNGKKYWVLWRVASGNLDGAGVSAVTEVAAWLTDGDKTAFTDGNIGTGAGLSRINYTPPEGFEDYDYLTIYYELINLSGNPQVLIRNDAGGEGIPKNAEGGATQPTLAKGAGTIRIPTEQITGELLNIIIATASNTVNLFRVDRVTLTNELPLINEAPALTPASNWNGTTEYSYDGKDWWVLWRNAANLDGAGLSALTNVAAWLTDGDKTAFTNANIGDGTQGLSRINYTFSTAEKLALENYEKVIIYYELINLSGNTEVLIRNDAADKGLPLNAAGEATQPVLSEGVGGIAIPTEQITGNYLNIIMGVNAENINLFRVTKVEFVY